MWAEDQATSLHDASPPSIVLNDPPTKLEVLAYLDWEIQNIREQAKVTMTVLLECANSIIPGRFCACAQASSPPR